MAVSISNLQIEATDCSDKTNDGMVASRSSSLVSSASRDATPKAKETKIDCKFVYPATTVIHVKLRSVEREMKVLLFFEEELPNMVMNITGAEEDVKTAILVASALLNYQSPRPMSTFETVRTAQTNQTMRRTYAQLLQPNQKIIGPISLESLKKVKTFQRVVAGGQTPSPPKITADVQSSFGAPASFQRSPALPATVASVTSVPLFSFSPKTSDVPARQPDTDVIDKSFTLNALASSSQDLKATAELTSNKSETSRVSFTAPSQLLPASSGLPLESKSQSPSRFSLSSTFGPASLVGKKFKPPSEEPFLVSVNIDGHNHKRKFDATMAEANHSEEKSHSIKGTNFGALPDVTSSQSQSSVVTTPQQFKGSFGPAISARLSTAASSFAQSSILSKLMVASGANGNASFSTNYAPQPTSFSSSFVRNPVVPSVAASDAANPPRVCFEQSAFSTAAPTFMPSLDRNKFNFASGTVSSASGSTNFNASHLTIPTSTGFFAPMPRSATTPNLALTASGAAETRLEQTEQDPGALLGQKLPRYGEETGKTRAYCCDDLEEEDFDDDEAERNYEMLLSDEDEHRPEAAVVENVDLDPASACLPGPSSEPSKPLVGFSPSQAFKVTLSTSTSTRRVLLPTPGQQTKASTEPDAEAPSATAAEFISDGTDQQTSTAGEEKKMVWRKVNYYQGEPLSPLQTNRGGFGMPRNYAGGNNGASTPQQLKVFQPGDFANGNNTARGQVSNRKQPRREWTRYSNEDIQAFNAIFSSQLELHVNPQGVKVETDSPTFVDTHMHLDFALGQLFDDANYAYLKQAAADELWSKFKDLNKVTWPGRFEMVITDFCRPKMFMNKDWQDFLRCCLKEPQIRVSIGVHPHWAKGWDRPGVQEFIRTVAMCACKLE